MGYLSFAVNLVFYIRTHSRGTCEGLFRLIIILIIIIIIIIILIITIIIITIIIINEDLQYRCRRLPGLDT